MTDTKNPMEATISGKERSRRIDTLKENAQAFVERIVVPALTKSIKKSLEETDAWSVIVDSEDADHQTLLFHYPKVFDYLQMGGGLGGKGLSRGKGLGGAGLSKTWEVETYILPRIKLEFGARGEKEPNELRTIIPYVAVTFPQFFDAPTCDVPTLAVERTFWEKVTILHALYHDPRMREKMSRHYYDTCMLARGGVAEKAMQNLALLEQVVRNKSLLFQNTKASYETAVPGSLRLLPAQEQLVALKKDYKEMIDEGMFMGDTLDFETIMSTLAELEQRVNKAA